MVKAPAFESLDDSKFSPLAKNTMINVLGGKTTEARSFVVSVDVKFENNKRYQRNYIKSFSSDDIRDDGTECYTDLEYCYSDWAEA